MQDISPEQHLDVFLRAHKTVALRLTQMFAEAGAVPPTEARVLAFLSRAEGRRMRMDALSQELGMTRGATSRIVGRLERSGYVRRETAKHDRRAIYAVLTPQGREALRHVTQVFRSVFDAVFLSGLSPEELNQMTALLARLAQANQPGRQAALEAGAPFRLPGEDAQASWAFLGAGRKDP